MIENREEQDHFGTKGKAYFVRVQVFNKGKSSAKGCTGEIQRIVNLTDSKGIGPFVPVIAQWASGLKNKYDKSVDIRRGSFATLGLIFVSEGGKGFTLDKARGAPNLGSRLRGYDGKKYAIEFVVSGENFDAETWTAVVEQNTGAGFNRSLAVEIRRKDVKSNFGV